MVAAAVKILSNAKVEKLFLLEFFFNHPLLSQNKLGQLRVFIPVHMEKQEWKRKLET